MTRDWKITTGAGAGILIGEICGETGGIVIKTEDGKFYWMIENIPEQWYEIPESLYMALFDYEYDRSPGAYVFYQYRK